MTQDVLIEEIISSFWENIYLELFLISIIARQDEGVIFLLTSLTMETLRIFCFVLFYILFGRKKKTGLAWTNIVLRRILTAFIKIIKLSTVSPNIPFAESERYDFMFVFNIARKQIMGGDCAALYAY